MFVSDRLNIYVCMFVNNKYLKLTLFVYSLMQVFRASLRKATLQELLGAVL